QVMTNEANKDAPIDEAAAQDAVDDAIGESKLRLNNRKMPGFGKLPKTVEQLLDTPGVGIPIGDPVRIPIPKLPKRRSQKGKKGTTGKPGHQPTQAMRQYCYDFMCQGGTQIICAHNLGISVMTLVKYYEYELELAEGRKDIAVDGVLFRNALRADGNKDFQRSMEFYYKRHGKTREQMDITSGGDALQSNVIVVPAVNVLPKSDDDIPE
ncbi:MAG: hypothetical protein K8953_11265, partial [Proteobacteria bacterium]|nr:hypothetical protein [Pseudomonadota bacterium]